MKTPEQRFFAAYPVMIRRRELRYTAPASRIRIRKVSKENHIFLFLETISDIFVNFN
jgi:hypothetical protein